MPRTARIAPTECVYHILTRGNNRQDVFKDEEDYQKYLQILKKYKEKFKFKIYHYALMSNHVHLVLEPALNGGSLASIMKGINLSYAQYYKGKYEHIGHFWQDRYKSILVSKDEYLLACGSYVELNPVRAKIVTNPSDYRWSSYNVYAYGKKDSIVDEHLIYEEFSKDKAERTKKYQEFVNGMIKSRNAMSGEMDQRMIYGSDKFIQVMEKKHNVEGIVKPRGRPRTLINKG